MGVAVHPALVRTGAPGLALDTLDPFAYELTQAQEEADRLLAVGCRCRTVSARAGRARARVRR